MEPSSPVGAAVAAKAVAIIRDERIVGRAGRGSAFAPWIANEGTNAAMLTTRALTAAAVERMGAAGERMAPYPPDLAVEVVSPNDSTRDLAEKIAHDEQVGVPLLWVVRPRRRAVEVRPHTSP